MSHQEHYKCKRIQKEEFEDENNYPVQYAVDSIYAPYWEFKKRKKEKKGGAYLIRYDYMNKQEGR